MTMFELARATASKVDEQVEVVYIPEDGTEKGQGVIQCRAKSKVGCGTLRLYPHGGTLLHDQDTIGRKHIERRSNMQPCYRHHAENFLMYSAMGNNGLATTGLNDEITLNYISPFWAVMLASRDTTEMVNMSAHMYVRRSTDGGCTRGWQLRMYSSRGSSWRSHDSELGISDQQEGVGSRRPACIAFRCWSVADMLRSVSPRCEYVADSQRL